MAPNIRVAVTGVSHWHTAMHLPALRAAGAKLIGVSDQDTAVAERVANEYSAPYYENLEEMIDRAEPQALLIMGLPTQVAAAAAVAVAAGVPSIVEKPVGLLARDVEALVSDVERAGAFVTVPLTNRYSQLWSELRSHPTGKGAARRLHAHFRVVNGVPSRYREMGVEWVLDPAVSGGGALRNLGIHAVDAFLQFAASDEVSVRSATLHRSFEEPAIEDFASATLVSASGIVGTIEAGYTLAAKGGSDTEWRVATSNKYLIDRNQTLRIVDMDAGTDETVSTPTVRERYDLFVADTLTRIHDGRQPLVTLRDYMNATRVIDQIYDLAAGVKEDRT